MTEPFQYQNIQRSTTRVPNYGVLIDVHAYPSPPKALSTITPVETQHHLDWSRIAPPQGRTDRSDALLIPGGPKSTCIPDGFFPSRDTDVPLICPTQMFPLRLTHGMRQRCPVNGFEENLEISEMIQLSDHPPNLRLLVEVTVGP